MLGTAEKAFAVAEPVGAGNRRLVCSEACGFLQRSQRVVEAHRLSATAYRSLVRDNRESTSTGRKKPGRQTISAGHQATTPHWHHKEQVRVTHQSP